MIFGHSLDIGEITPSIFLNLNKTAKTQAFVTLYNACVSAPLRLKQTNATSIKEAFLSRIEELLKMQNLKPVNYANSLCIASNAIIKSYKSKNFAQICKTINEPKHNAAKMIKMLYKNGEFELIFDANFMFFQFVYDRISRKHFDKSVYFQDNIIKIDQNGKNLLCIMPSFKRFDIEKRSCINDEIASATTFLQNSECKRIYVVMPRHSEFRRHIEVRHRQCEHKLIKLVPYTISNQNF